MARTATVFEILVASPSDVSADRGVVREAMLEWNMVHGRGRDCVLEPIMWETHATPEMGDRPQAIINGQLLATCDALVGTFWTRLGSPTGDAPSGTVEEIRKLMTAGKPVMLYFSSRPVDPTGIDASQLTALRAFKGEMASQGLLEEYADLGELRRRLSMGLTRLVDKLLRGDAAPTQSPLQEQMTTVDARQLRRWLKEWQLNAKLRHSGHDAGKSLMASFADWYLENHEDIQASSDQWETLANLATQLTSYRFTLGGDSSENFYQIGDGVLANAVALVESGSVVPQLGPLGLRCLQTLSSSKTRDERESADAIAGAVGADIADVNSALAKLETLGLINRMMYFNAPVDYGLTGRGWVRAALEQAEAV